MDILPLEFMKKVTNAVTNANTNAVTNVIMETECDDTNNFSNYNDNTNTTTTIQNLNQNSNNSKMNQQVCSYGLICFYKKKTVVKDTQIVNNLLNRKTKKTGNSLCNSNSSNSSNSNNSNSNNNNKNNNKNNKYYRGNNANVSRIKILKRHESISYTLKNMSGVVGATSDEQDAIDGIIDNQEVEEIMNINGSINCSIDGSIVGKGESETNNTENILLKEVIINKILLVQRRNTIGFIEFIRGKYNVNDYNYIIKLFNMMTFDEKRILRAYESFDMIRTVIGLKRENNYKGEYDDAKRKYMILKQHQNGDLVNALLDKSFTKWSSPEWGIPKGRRNNKEYDIDCAVREFVEETGIKCKNINVYRNIKPIEELYTGINGVVYKHIYYIAEIKNTPEANENVIRVEKGGFLNYEISNIKLFSLTEAHKLIRPYYVSKLNAIKKGFEIIEDISISFE
jgi:8-oxo-dGTP pyrophosphatase MutT (NUDIX family)